MSARAPLIAALVALALPAGAAPTDHYIGVVLGSAHVGTADLNNVNPGLTYGVAWPTANPRRVWFVEGGVFYNSYREVSPLLVVGTAWDLGRLGPARMRLGVEAGTASYRKLSVELQRDYGIPNLAGFIPIVGLTLTAELGQTELRLTTVPAGQNVRAIVNLSLARHF